MLRTCAVGVILSIRRAVPRRTAASGRRVVAWLSWPVGNGGDVHSSKSRYRGGKMKIQSMHILQIEAVNRSACLKVPAHSISRSEQPPRLGRVAPIFFIVVLSVCGIRARVASGEDELLARFQSPARGEIVSRYAAGTLTVEGKSDTSSGKWWTGTYSVKLTDLDFENLNFGTFTMEPGATATLSCKANSECVSKKGKWTQIKCDADICNKGVDPSGTDRSIDIWCESLDKCKSFVKALKEVQTPVPK
jgi:hypothetical protein